MRYETVVLGGGLAGLSAAFHLEGRAPLYEQQPDLGGLCRQVTVDGFRFDAVPHVLHFRHDATRELVHRLLDGRLHAYDRQARVYAHGTFLRYPFQAHLYGLPAEVIEECVQGRLHAAPNGGPDLRTFERWIVSTFGPGIARHFMVPYNTKFWTVPPSELTCEWLDGLVPVPTVEQTIQGAVSDDSSEYGYNVRFWYPDAGLGAITQALLSRIPHVRLGKRLVRIETAAKRLHFADGEVVAYERLLSSIPLPELRRLLDPLPPAVDRALGRLRWTSLTVVHLGVRGPALAPWHWVYVPDAELVFYRVGIPSHYAPDAAPDGSHLLSTEVSHAPEGGCDPHLLTQRVIRDLARLGLLRDARDVSAQLALELHYGYPLYDRDYAWATRLIRDFLEAQGITPMGRFGSWRYLSMEQALLDGQRAAARSTSQSSPVRDETVLA